jgi:hypothetical protein
MGPATVPEKLCIYLYLMSYRMVRMISSYTRDVLTPATVPEKLGKHHVVYIRITYLTDSVLRMHPALRITTFLHSLPPFT